MAHVERRGPKTWVAVYPDPSRKSGRGSKTFRRKVDAERFIAVTTAGQLRGEWVDPRAGKITVRQYGEQWLAGRTIRKSTRERYADYLSYINRLGDWPLANLTASTVESWQSGLMSGGLAASTSTTIRGVFAGMLNSAVRDRLIPSSPFAGVATIKRVRRLVQPMPAATVIAIRETITPKYRAAVMVGAGCGLRRGECFGLTVDRVDFLRRTITVDRQVVGVDAGRPVYGPPKTPASVRVVPMPQSVVDALARHLAAWPAQGDGLIFTAPRGGPVTRAKFGPTWQNAAGAPTGSRFHDLRHFYASTLIEGGRSVKEVQARLGHATAAETLDTYAHLWPNNEDGTRGAIDAAFTAADAVEDDDTAAGDA